LTAPVRGLGGSPLGAGPYGWGTIATAPTPGGGIYRGPQGQQYNSRAISVERATLGQYIYDEFGRAVGGPDVQQLVILAAKTDLGSAAVQDLGNTFGETRFVGDDFAAQQTARANETFKDLVDRGLVRIDSIEVDGGGGLPAVTTVHLTDLTTGNPIDVPLS
jgi:hypothetical protein